jgi:hypothetical protein
MLVMLSLVSVFMVVFSSWVGNEKAPAAPAKLHFRKLGTSMLSAKAPLAM